MAEKDEISPEEEVMNLIIAEVAAKASQRIQDLALYGRYIEVDGERVDPMSVHYEVVEAPERPKGMGLVEWAKTHPFKPPGVP